MILLCMQRIKSNNEIKERLNLNDKGIKRTWTTTEDKGEVRRL